MILNQSQAEAVYSAMCALNNVFGRIKAQFGDVSDDGVNVFEVDGSVNVVRVRHYDVLEAEYYASQAAFAAAYGLNSDAAPDAPGAVVNPLDNTSLRHERVNSAAGRAIAERFNP